MICVRQTGQYTPPNSDSSCHPGYSYEVLIECVLSIRFHNYTSFQAGPNGPVCKKYNGRGISSDEGRRLQGIAVESKKWQRQDASDTQAVLEDPPVRAQMSENVGGVYFPNVFSPE